MKSEKLFCERPKLELTQEQQDFIKDASEVGGQISGNNATLLIKEMVYTGVIGGIIGGVVSLFYGKEK